MALQPTRDGIASAGNRPQGLCQAHGPQVVSDLAWTHLSQSRAIC